MATTPDLHEAEIASARTAAWHQAGVPLLTLEAARTFLNEHGLVLFAPRSLGAPAPSLVEATLGTAQPSATAAESDTARGLAARLIGEGSAVPLNLLGGPGDLPDFLVSASAFPFVFTLRGDKGWKRPPETTGSVKVTPLALRVYELLAERGAMTVANIVPEIGREVTESAIARALSELWTLLRVIPALQQGGGETQWELLTARFLKAVKAGANAGQPTALSALISLYLGQVFLATEEEVASFLSPLTARSRVRDVLHGLTAGRQLSEAVLEGKTVLYLPESLPDFAQLAQPDEAEGAGMAEAFGDGGPLSEDSGGSKGSEPAEGRGAEDLDGASAPGKASEAADAAQGRIRRFEGGAPGAAKPFRGKPATREGGFRAGPRSAERGARPSRSFGAGASRPPRDASGAPRHRDAGDRANSGPGGRDNSEARSSFARPWDEERAARPSREGASRPPRREGTGDRPFRPARFSDDSRPPRREGTGEGRPPFRSSSRPENAGGRPPFRREGYTDAPRPYPARPRREDGDSPQSRRPFPDSRNSGQSSSSPGSNGQNSEREGGRGDRRPERTGFAPRRDFNRPDRAPQGDRPPRRDAGEQGDRPRTNRPFSPRDSGPRAPRSGGDRPSFPRSGADRPRPSFGGSNTDRPARNFDRPSPGGSPRFRDKGEDRGAGRGSDRDNGGGRPPFRGDRPSFRSAGSDRPPFRGDRPEVHSFSGRPPRADGARPRPQGGFADRSGPRSNSGPTNSYPGGKFNRGPGKGAPRDRSAPPRPRPRPEDEA